MSEITTIQLKRSELETLKNVQTEMYGTTAVPYTETLSVLCQEKLDELNRGDNQ